MAVTQEFYESRRDVGNPALTALLGGWLGERHAMNTAQEGGADATKLAELELKAREGLGRLEEALAKAQRGDRQATSDLAEEMLRGKWQIEIAGIHEHGRLAQQKLITSVAFMEQARKEDANLAKAVEIKTDTENSMKGVAQATSNDARVAQFNGLLANEGVTDPKDPKRMSMAAKQYNRIRETQGAAAAAEFSRSIEPAENGDDLNGVYTKRHSPNVYEAVMKRAHDEQARVSAGGNPDVMDDFLDGIAQDMGVSKAALLGQVDRIEMSGGFSASEEGRRPEGPSSASVGMSGVWSPEAAQAMSEAQASGASPYAGLMAAIRAQSKYADDLASQRSAASRSLPTRVRTHTSRTRTPTPRNDRSTR